MKLKTKGLDAIVANPLDTMDSQKITAKILTPDDRVHTPPAMGPMDKDQFAQWFVSWMDGWRT